MTDYSSEDFWKGAPEGATHYQPAKHHNQRPAFWRVVGGVAREVWCLSADSALLNDHFRYGPDGNDCFDAVMSIPRPAPPWSGDGLPPVGTHCELHISGDNWQPCEVIAMDEQDGQPVSVVRYGGGYYGADLSCLRPIKTQAQIAAEEREAAVEAMMELGIGHLSRQEFCMALHDSGLRFPKGDDK